jgi:hypothetical protein
VSRKIRDAHKRTSEVRALSDLRPGARVGAGEVWASGPTAGTAWVAVPDPGVAGVVHGAGTRAEVSVVEQRARIARAATVTEVGAVATGDTDGPRGMFGAPRCGVVHVPGCPAATGGDVLQRAEVARAALAGDLDGLVDARHVRGQYRTLRWCPDCLREEQQT